MRKVLIAVASLVTIAVVGYSAVWCYGAYKIQDTLATYVASINKKDENLQISYSSIKFSGFPGVFNVAINDPTLVQKQTGAEVTIKGEKLLLLVDLKNDIFTISPVGNISETIQTKEQTKTVNVQYQKVPTLEVKLKSHDSWKKSPEESNFINEIQDAHYSDQGMKIVDSSGVVISQLGQAVINMKGSRSTDGKQNTALSFVLRDFEAAPEYMPHTIKLPGKISLDGEITFAGTLEHSVQGKYSETASISNFSKMELNFSKLSISSGDMAIILHGQVKTSKKQLLPDAEVGIEVVQVQKLLDYLASVKLIRDAVRMRSVLEKIAEPSNEEANMHFLIKGNPTKITIGKLHLEEIVALAMRSK